MRIGPSTCPTRTTSSTKSTGSSAPPPPPPPPDSSSGILPQKLHHLTPLSRSHNQITFVKKTMFQSKIQQKSEVELRDYWKKWLIEVERQGYLDPRTYEAKRVA